MFEWMQVAKTESQAVPMAFIVCTHGGRFSGACYAKATSVDWGFSEGGTHEETLRPQDLEWNKR